MYPANQASHLVRRRLTILGSSQEAYFLPPARLSRHSRRHKPPSWRTWQHRRVQQVRDHEQRPLSTLASLQTISAPPPLAKVVVNAAACLGEPAIATTASLPHQLAVSPHHRRPALVLVRHPHPPTASWSMHCLRPARRIQSLSSPTARAHRTVRPIPPRRLTSVCGRCSLRHTDHAARQT